MAQGYQDAMALVREFGKPDLFVTMTCNPTWHEIKREPKQGQTANDRPDLVVRVFEQQGLYPAEFLNKLEFSGMQPHELRLQEGCPIIFLRNITSGLANGTRLIVIKLMDRLIEAEVATGPAKGQRVFIPRLSITPSDADKWPFTLCRRQFPVRAAFAMTVNKS